MIPIHAQRSNEICLPNLFSIWRSECVREREREKWFGDFSLSNLLKEKWELIITNLFDTQNRSLFIWHSNPVLNYRNSILFHFFNYQVFFTFYKHFFSIKFFQYVLIFISPSLYTNVCKSVVIIILVISSFIAFAPHLFCHAVQHFHYQYMCESLTYFLLMTSAAVVVAVAVVAGQSGGVKK